MAWDSTCLAKRKNKNRKGGKLKWVHSSIHRFQFCLRRDCSVSRSRGRSSLRGESDSARERAQPAGRLARAAETQVLAHTFQETVVRLSQRRADRAPQAGRAERMRLDHAQQSDPLEGRRAQPLL